MFASRLKPLPALFVMAGASHYSEDCPRFPRVKVEKKAFGSSMEKLLLERLPLQ